MNGVLSGLLQYAMLAFLLAGMVELGLGLTVGQLVAPLRRWKLVLGALLVNFVAAPLLAIGIAKGLRLDSPHAQGLLLLGLAPGAPFIPKIVQVARGDLPLAAGAMVLLMIGTVVVLPVALPRLIPGAAVDPWPVAKPLVLFMLLPLAAGMLMRARIRSLPAGLRPGLGRVSNVSGLLVLVLIVALNIRDVAGVFGSGAILAGAVFVAVTAGLGARLGGGDPAARRSLGLAAGSRNVAAALLVGARNFPDPGVNVMVIVSALAGLLVLFSAAKVIGRRTATLRPQADGPGQEADKKGLA